MSLTHYNNELTISNKHNSIFDVMEVYKLSDCFPSLDLVRAIETGFAELIWKREEESYFDDVINKTIKEWFDKKKQPCEDCISRQNATAKLFQSMIINSSEFGNELSSEEKKFNDGLRKAVEIIRSLPNIQPQPKTGHWICHRDHCENLGVIPSGLGVYEWCSNCDCGIDIRDWQRNPHDFCPNCGADMRESEE